MGQGVFTLFEKVTTGKLMEAISKSMDDFLYIFDIQNRIVNWSFLRLRWIAL